MVIESILGALKVALCRPEPSDRFHSLMAIANEFPETLRQMARTYHEINRAIEQAPDAVQAEFRNTLARNQALTGYHVTHGGGDD